MIMSEANPHTVRAYNVMYEDEFLGVEDYRTIRASDEDEALDIFDQEYVDDEDRYEIKEVEVAYELNQGKIEDLINFVID